MAVISSDILVNGGAGLAARFLKSTAHIEEPIAKVSEINRLITAHYQSIVVRNPSQEVFLKCWLNRGGKQRELIEKY